MNKFLWIAVLPLYFQPLDLQATQSRFKITTASSSDSAIEIKATPTEGHHFNLDAPNRLADKATNSEVKPGQKNEKAFLFSLDKKTALAKKYDLNLYICDDAKTFCERHSQQISFDSKGEIVAASADPLPAPIKPDSAVVVKNGFIQNNLEHALKEASKRKTPVLIDFAAIWCPACLKLDHEVLQTRDFLAATRDFVRVRIDSDWVGSAPFAQRYHVKDIPTIVITNEYGEEMFRIHGYRPKDILLAELKAFQSQKKVTLRELQARAEKGDREASDHLGLLAYDALRFSDAIQYWNGTKKHQERLLIAEVRNLMNEAKSSGSKEKYIRAAQKVSELIKRYPDSVEAPSRHLELASLYESAQETEKRKAALEAAIHTADRFIKNPQLSNGKFSIDAGRDDTEVHVGEFWAHKANAQKKLGLEKESQESWNRAILETRKNITSSRDRGRRLLLVNLLKQAGRDPEIDPVLEELQKAFPLEYTYYQKRAARFLEKGNLVQAHELARKALEFSYGANRVACATLLAKILVAQNKKADAKALAKTTLAGISEPNEKESRLYRQIQELRSFL